MAGFADPLTRLFSAQILAQDPSALERLKDALKRNDGNVEATAAELRIGARTLHRWGDTLPWVTAVVEQHARTRGSPKRITYNGVTRSLAEWADELGLKHTTLGMRLRSGMPLERALQPSLDAVDRSPKRKPKAAKKAPKRAKKRRSA